jgi:predicted RND superfamily exporter protein
MPTLLIGRLLTIPLRAPRSTLAVLFVLTVFFAFFARGIRVDSAIENLLPAHDPDRLYYEEIKRLFGSDEATVVGIFADDIFTPATLRVIERLTTKLGKIDGVEQVYSVTNVKGVETDEYGLRVGRLMRELPRTREEAEELRRRVLEHPFFAGNVVSRDARATGIVVVFQPLSDEEFLSRDVEGQIRRAVEQEEGALHFAITGMQTMKVQGARLMEEDLARFLPVSFVLVVVILAWAFRTVRGVCLPLGAVTMGVVWTLGLMVMTGKRINMGTLVMPPLLMAVGIAYAIHIVSRYYHEVRPGLSREEILRNTVAEVRMPVAAAAFTTLLGFATLAFNPIPAIRDFGLFSMFGISSIFLMSVAFIPAALLVLPTPVRLPKHHAREAWASVLLEAVGRRASQHRRFVLALTILICLLSVWGATRIRVETNYLTFFAASNEIRRANTEISERLGGAQPIFIVVEGDAEDSISQVETLAAIRDLEEFINRQPGVDTSLSVVDYLAVARSALNPDAPPGELPKKQSEVNQLLLFVGPQELKPVVNPELSRANIIARTRLAGSAEVREFVSNVEKFAAKRFRRGIHVRATGAIVVLNRTADTLAQAQVTGLWQVLVVLMVLMSLMFLSLRAGLLSLVPNMVPIIILFGIMGWTGISLNISTSMIAVIAIGIAVDDTIHYLSSFNTQLRTTGHQEGAILHVGRSVGLAIVFTSIALSAGFLVVCVSNFMPIRDFGILASITMIVALFSDLVVTPALVMTAGIITLWDLMYVKLGQQPHKEIPLFAGLRPFQAKIVVLMARLAAARPGTFITRRGEMKQELYVLLDGRVDVRGKDGARVLRTLGRGDVIGEMGLVRARPRSADVLVAQDTEYLVLDGGFLDRLQRRYPRIAAKVFLNLTRILSDRLESTTNELIKLSEPEAHGTSD